MTTRPLASSALVPALAAAGVVVAAIGVDAFARWRRTEAWTYTTVTRIESQCHRDLLGATCTITNTMPYAVVACVRPRLTSKEKPSSKLSTITLCTGRLPANDTTTVSGRWADGTADDVCTPKGSEKLDWSACTFEVEDRLPAE